MSEQILLDSHIFLWILQEPDKIGPKTKLLLKASFQRYISLATIWELGLKHQKGKLAFSAAELLSVAGKLYIDMLPIKERHVISATELDIKNRGPFDRMLLAQAQTENIKLVTADKELISLGYNYIVDARK